MINNNYSNKYSIGTAQLGMKYGIANNYGKISAEEAKNIFSNAYRRGIKYLDTAIAYGESEYVLGKIGVNNWNVTTKLPPIPIDCPDIEYWVNSIFQNSLNLLKLKKVNTLLLHNPNDLLGENSQVIYKIIQSLKERKLINKFGVSLYEVNKINLILSKFKIDIIQVPFNIIDRRILKNDFIGYIKDKNIEINVRSIFLQGLLLMNSKKRPKKFEKWNYIWNKFNNWTKDLKISPLQACLGYVLSFPKIDKIIIGVDSNSQLLQIFNVKKPILDVPNEISCSNIQLIDPSKWNFLKN